MFFYKPGPLFSTWNNYDQIVARRDAFLSSIGVRYFNGELILTPQEKEKIQKRAHLKLVVSNE